MDEARGEEKKRSSGMWADILAFNECLGVVTTACRLLS